MRSAKTFLFFLFTLGLIGFMGSISVLMAGQTDPPHQAHLVFLRGPGMGGDASPCLNCHTGGSPGTGDVDWDTCNRCHSPGGAYDGVNDPIVGALDNWENRESGSEATQSLIYNGDGTLRADKDKWCATCHDKGTGILVDDFGAYTDDASLRVNWSGGADAQAPYLEPSGGPAGSQCMRVNVDWDKDAADYGTVKQANDYVPPFDLEGMKTISFYVKVEEVFSDSIEKIKVRLTKPDDVVCVAAINTDNLAENSWELVTIPFSDFSNNDIPGATLADQGVKRIALRMMEGGGNDNWSEDVYFDDISFGVLPVQAPDVVGDNVTQGYYVTGHHFGCTSCHDPSTDHIDGETASLYGYFTGYSNPTGFRLYSDSFSRLQLPYNEYVAGSEGAFALCYKCHDEAVITQDDDAEDLTTNFTDYGYIAGTTIDNLHLYHVGGPGSNMIALVYHGTCVMCHDPHGQSNPAMTRTDMGDFIYFDANGCEIAQDADSDSDGIKDWYDPDVNMGGAQKSSKGWGSYPMCVNVCHLTAVPPSDPCSPYSGPLGQDGWYSRDYEYVRHGGAEDVGPDCFSGGCHRVNKMHADHFVPDPGPGFPMNESGCNQCHADGRLQCAEGPLFADHELLSDTTVCDSCHGPGGPYTGQP